MLRHCLLSKHHRRTNVSSPFILSRVAQDLHRGERKAHLTPPNNTETEESISISPVAKTFNPPLTLNRDSRWDKSCSDANVDCCREIFMAHWRKLVRGNAHFCLSLNTVSYSCYVHQQFTGKEPHTYLWWIHFSFSCCAIAKTTAVFSVALNLLLTIHVPGCLCARLFCFHIAYWFGLFLTCNKIVKWRFKVILLLKLDYSENIDFRF